MSSNKNTVHLVQQIMITVYTHTHNNNAATTESLFYFTPQGSCENPDKQKGHQIQKETYEDYIWNNKHKAYFLPLIFFLHFSLKFPLL